MSRYRHVWPAILLLSFPVATLAQNAPVQPQPIEIEGAVTHVSKPNALVLFNPAVDTTAERLKDRVGDRGKEASPVHHVRAGLPPMVIFHGRSDTTVPYASVEAFCKAANDAGGACQLFGYEGAPHGFFNPSREGGKWYAETLLEADRFLTKISYLSEPVPKANR